MYTVATLLEKRLVTFLFPAGMSLTNSLGGNSLIIPGQGEFGKWQPLTFFYNVCFLIGFKRIKKVQNFGKYIN